MIKYIELPLQEVIQNDLIFYNLVVDANLIIDMFTVSPAKYKLATIKSGSFLEEEDEYFQKLDKNVNKGYQRFKDPKRVHEIKEYISHPENYHIIPNSIIFSIKTNIIINAEKQQIEALFEEYPLSFILNIKDDKNFLIIPETITNEAHNNEDFNPMLIIDGHHRLQGIKEYLHENPQVRFDVVGSLLINQDTMNEAEIFKTVNYEIKPVNKSYYYHIIGEFGVGKAEYIYLHYLVRLLNEANKSPLQRRIKMLGKKDYSITERQTISQAFLVEQMYTWLFMHRKKIHNSTIKRIPILAPFIMMGKEKIATRIIAKYFLSIENNYNNRYNSMKWNSDENQFLKTIGIGALIEILPAIIVIMIKKNNCINNQVGFFSKIKKNDFNIILEHIFSKDFDIYELLTKDFSKGSSQGLVKEFAIIMYNKIIDNETEYQKAENEYISWYYENMIMDI